MKRFLIIEKITANTMGMCGNERIQPSLTRRIESIVPFAGLERPA
jgi:hypothetical protein